MPTVLKLLWQKITSSLALLGRLVVTPAAAIGNSRGARRALLWAAHVLTIGAILFGLWWLNGWLELDRAVRVPSVLARSAWLPLLFLQLYVLLWLGWCLWRQFRRLQEPSPFPDIDAAWSEATLALSQQGIDPRQTPLFLVLGQPAGGESSLFHASGVPLSLPAVPRRPDAPLRVRAGEDGIFVTCPGVSLLSRQAERMHAAWNVTPEEIHCRQRPGEVQQKHTRPIYDDFPTAPADGTGAGAGEWPHETGAATAVDTHTATLPEENLDRVDEQLALALADEPAPDCELEQVPRLQRTIVPVDTLLTNREEIETISERLRYLGALIHREREPYCGANGVLALLPFAATDDDRQAQHVGMLAERDLDTLCDSLQVEPPVVAVFCDVETADGCGEFLHRFPHKQRDRRWGVELPHVTEAGAAAVPAMLADAAHWVCQELLPALVYRIVALRGNFAGRRQEETAGNAALYRFMQDMRHRQTRIIRLLQRAFCHSSHRASALRGWYLAATGADAARSQGFAAGIFPQFFEMQNTVCWTRGASSRDATARRIAGVGYAVIAAAVACATLAVVLLWK